MIIDHLLNNIKKFINLLKEWILVLIFLVFLVNFLEFIYLFLNSSGNSYDFIYINYYLFLIIFVCLFSSLVSFHIGYFILLIGVREVICKKFKLGRFLKLIIFLFPYIVMNLYFLELVNRFVILKILGFILLLVGLYLYFKVGLKTEERLRTE